MSDTTEFEPLSFRKLLALREGDRLTVYHDSRGFLTVGTGHLVVPNDHLKFGDRITQAQDDAFFAKDSAASMMHATAQAAQAGITEKWFLAYLGSVCFQLGNNWTAKWPHTWAMICAGMYEQAADSLMDTPWDKQTPLRVEDFSEALYNLPPKGGK
jgi:GH24 family phage-related lysozyme (muramidase)